MARVKIEMPPRFPFVTEIELRVTDMNYGGHMGNDALVSLLHEARVQMLRWQGLSEKSIDGLHVLQADLAVMYRAEGFAGDRLRFEVAVADLSRAGCDFFYRVSRVSDGTLVAEAKAGMVFVDPVSRKVAALPESMKRLAAL